MRVLLVDGNNLGFRMFIKMWETTGQLKNNMGVPTTVTFGVLRMINAFVHDNQIDKCVICWDGGSKYRKGVCKWYKYNRVKPVWAEKYYEELNVAREYLGKLGIPQAQKRGIECDDIIGLLSAHFRKLKDKVIILSDDKDYFQLSPYKVRLYRPTKMHLVGTEETTEIIGYNPKILPKVVAFTGEKKDNIPGVGGFDDEHNVKKVGVGVARALKWLSKPDGGYYSLKEAIKNVPESDRFYKNVQDNKKLIRKSYKLSRIRTKMDYYLDWEKDYLTNLLSRVQMPCMVKRSMAQNVSQFLEFKSMNMTKTLNRIGVKLI